MSQSLPTTFRSTLGGTLGLEDAGSEVRLVGWVHRRRDLGGLVFADLRDRRQKQKPDPLTPVHGSGAP